MADHQDLQILVKDILEGVGSMLDQHKKETMEEIRASENRTRALIEAQDKKISTIAEKVTSLDERMERVENRLDTLESDVKVIKAVVTAHSEEISTLKRVK